MIFHATSLDEVQTCEKTIANKMLHLIVFRYRLKRQANSILRMHAVRKIADAWPVQYFLRIIIGY